MNRYEIGGYIRINKTEARNRFERGERVYFCPCNLRPGAPWYPEVEQKKTACYLLFDNAVNAFEFYNCSNSETGRKAAFYVKEGAR